MTTLVTRLSCSPCRCDSARTAIQTWPMISAVVKFRLKPCFPVEQKVQFKAHPICDETHKVPRFASGI